MKRWRFILSGRVQGVGLRFRACSIARELKLTGWIANRDDGTVELEVQGDEPAADHFIEQIKALMYVRVDGITKEEIPVKSEHSFQMRY